MTDLQSAKVPTTLEHIEYRIAFHMQGAYDNVLEIGRCLNEAKESGLVPHGKWEVWVKRNTDMSVRQAQRLMQAASSVKSGSMMERMPITKIQALLALPEPEREPMAAKAVDEGMSLRELQEEVKRLNSVITATQDDANKRIQAIQANSQKEFDREQASFKVSQQFFSDQISILEKQLKDATESASANGITPEAQAEIDRLKTELADAEEYAEKQAELRKKAQQDLLEQQTMAARGDIQQDNGELTAADLAAAVREFIGRAGALPLMRSTLEKLNGEQRESFRQQLSIVMDWADRSREALSVIVQEHWIDDHNAADDAVPDEQEGNL